MSLASRSLVLPDGLQLHLLQQPAARQAAALVQIAAGSHHEPDRWPGLAHLLEHLLFTGSAAFPDDQRLMPWVQGAGGRVNATTLQQRTAFFFEVAAPQLAEGLARLMDMVAAPLFTPVAVQQEVAVIDAEYQLLQSHAQTLSEAALLDGVAQPAGFHRFHIGSRACFGEQVDALRAALRSFHQQHYHRGRMQLWLQGPQPLDELEQLARRVTAVLPVGPAPVVPPLPQLKPMRDSLLRVAGPERFWLSYLLSHNEQINRDVVTLLREFALDDAPGSLLATLRSQGLCEALNMQWLYLADNACWLALVFEGESLTPDRARKTEAVWLAWLQALRHSSPAQRAHYGELAHERFARLAPLDQLRERAFGFAPGNRGDFNVLISALSADHATRLFSAPGIEGELCCSQGLTFQRQYWQMQPADNVEPAFRFYPLEAVFAEPELPSAAQPLLHCEQGKQPATLILRPEFFHNFSAAEGKARTAQLRAFFGTLRHLGSEGEFSAREGVWQLRLRLPEQHRLWAVNAALTELAKPLSESRTAQEEGIAIRTLLAQLPEQLHASQPFDHWRAALTGGDAALHQALTRLLSAFPATFNAAQRPDAPPPLRPLRRVTHASDEQALLLFVPLPSQDEATLAAARALALLYEPRFFQRLRVEQQVGYVVSCRYQRCGDRDGILFALQSPDQPPAALLRHCKNFLRSFSSVITAAELANLQSRLMPFIQPQQDADAALRALRQQAGLPLLTEAAIQALTPADLHQLHQRLRRERRRWLALFCGGRIAPG